MLPYKLGKTAPREDPRTFPLRALLKANQLPAPPVRFDADDPACLPDATIALPTPMFANDVYGDCVIAGRAHATLRFERYSQAAALAISDEAVTSQYFRETGGADGGLNLLSSLNCWRNTGWPVNGNTYQIDAFASVRRSDLGEVMQAISLFTGIVTGFDLPISASDQMEAGQVWTPLLSQRGRKGSWGGHCMYLSAYDESGLTALTWGRKQRMSWDFFALFCDEAFAVVDALDAWLPSDPLDVPRLRDLLQKL